MPNNNHPLNWEWIADIIQSHGGDEGLDSLLYEVVAREIAKEIQEGGHHE